MKRTRRVLSVLFAAVLVLCGMALFKYDKASALTKDSKPIMVSLGDSYSSGEGIEPFYGQDKALEEKVKDPDWLAHRSQLVWSGKLTLKGLDGTMSDYKDVNWFFVASSGAKVGDLTSSQEKTYNQGPELNSTEKLAPQLDVFDKLEAGSVDYVTVTIGGNDIGFVNLLTTALSGSKDSVSEYLTGVWDNFYKEGGIREDIKNAYKAIADKAGSQATIIVAGYPKLFNADGFEIGMLGLSKTVDASLAKIVNDSVSMFNAELAKIVSECAGEGMNIVFADVEKEFEGHEAYTKEPYINELIFGAKPEDTNMYAITSAYSMHPNTEGAKAYAKAVQKVIDNLEGTESGEPADEDWGSTVRVSTQKELNKALQDPDVSTIILRTKAYLKFNIKPVEGTENKKLIIDCLNATINNYTVFSSITIDSSYFYYERVSGNDITLPDINNTVWILIGKNKKVKSLTLGSEYGNYDGIYYMLKGSKIENLQLIHECENDSVKSTYNPEKREVSIDFTDAEGCKQSVKLNLDMSGRIIQSECISDNPEHEYLYTYQYGKTGFCVKETGKDNTNGSYVKTSTYTSENSLITQETIGDFSTFFVECSYDEKGRRIQEKVRSTGTFDGKEYELEYVYNFKVNDKGFRVGSYYEATSTLDELTYNYAEDKTINSKGFLKKMTMKYYGGYYEDEEYHITHTYKYNKAGDLIKYKLDRNGDYAVGEFTYDELGELIDQKQVKTKGDIKLF